MPATNHTGTSLQARKVAGAVSIGRFAAASHLRQTARGQTSAGASSSSSTPTSAMLSLAVTDCAILITMPLA